MLGPLSDKAGNAVKQLSAQGPRAIEAVAQIQHTFEWQLRLIILAGTVGTILGSLMLPMFVYLYVRGVRSFERTKSLPHSLARLFSPRVLWEVLRQLRVPRLGEMGSFLPATFRGDC